VIEISEEKAEKKEAEEKSGEKPEPKPEPEDEEDMQQLQGWRIRHVNHQLWQSGKEAFKRP